MLFLHGPKLTSRERERESSRVIGWRKLQVSGLIVIGMNVEGRLKNPMMGTWWELNVTCVGIEFHVRAMCKLTPGHAPKSYYLTKARRWILFLFSPWDPFLGSIANSILKVDLPIKKAFHWLYTSCTWRVFILTLIICSIGWRIFKSIIHKHSLIVKNRCLIV